MAPQPLESRVESRKHRVTQLEQLPARIDNLTSQVQQLGTEMRAEFSAVRGELRGEIAGQGTSLRAAMAEQGKSLRAEIADQGASLLAAIAEQGARIDAQGTYMRVLHEEVLARIALMQNGRSSQSRRPRKK